MPSAARGRLPPTGRSWPLVAWHDAAMTDRRSATTGSPPATRAGGRRSWRRPSTTLLDDLEPVVRRRRSGVVDIGTGHGTARARRPAALAAASRSSGVDASAEMRGVADAEADRACRGVARPLSRRAWRSPTSCRSPDGAFDARDVVVRAPARPEPGAGAARGAPRAPARAASLAYVSWLAGRAPCSSPDRVFDDVLDDARHRPARTATAATGRHADRSSAPPASCGRPGFAEVDGAGRACSSTASRRRLRRVPHASSTRRRCSTSSSRTSASALVDELRARLGARSPRTS